jgi:hypothetical protein
VVEYTVENPDKVIGNLVKIMQRKLAFVKLTVAEDTFDAFPYHGFYS